LTFDFPEGADRFSNRIIFHCPVVPKIATTTPTGLTQNIFVILSETKCSVRRTRVRALCAQRVPKGLSIERDSSLRLRSVCLRHATRTEWQFFVKMRKS